MNISFKGDRFEKMFGQGERKDSISKPSFTRPGEMQNLKTSFVQ